MWRRSPRSVNFFSLLLPCILPSLALPFLNVLHTLARGQLSFKEAVLLAVPPSPILFHLILAMRSLKGVEKIRYLENEFEGTILIYI